MKQTNPRPSHLRKPYERLNRGVRSNNWYDWSNNNQIDWEGHLKAMMTDLRLDIIRRNNPNRIRGQLSHLGNATWIND